MLMPGMDGFQLLEELRHHPPLQDMPVIFLTAAQDRELLLRAFDSGAVDYVTKPFIPEELLARVGAHVALKLARDRLERVARERQELVNLVAHDLKNPLSSVLFASDILMQDGCRPERMPRYLQMIHESAHDAIGYIRRYLEGQERIAATGWRRSAHASGRVAGDHRMVGAALRDATRKPRHAPEDLRARSVRHGRDRSPRAAPGHREPDHQRDEVRRRRRRTHAGSRAFEQRRVTGSCACSIAGPACRGDKRRDLFKPFMRLSGRDDGLSSGLGLSLARQIIVNAGGELWYEDRDGGGAVFVIELPAAAR